MNIIYKPTAWDHALRVFDGDTGIEAGVVRGQAARFHATALDGETDGPFSTRLKAAIELVKRIKE